jgi:transporter family-2 protein
MPLTRYLSLFGLGILAGALITVQSVLNATLGKKAGNLGSVLVLTLISFLFLVLLILVFPGTSNLRGLPGLSEWHLYLGGLLGVVILAVPIFLVPRIGATSTLTALVMGQLFLALVVDYFGLFASPKLGLDLWRVLGVVLVVIGAYFVSR